MAEQKVNLEDMLRTVMYVQEAIINILEQKGLVSRGELIGEVQKQQLRFEQFGKQN